jgi:hypothetical protein
MPVASFHEYARNLSDHLHEALDRRVYRNHHPGRTDFRICVVVESWILDLIESYPSDPSACNKGFSLLFYYSSQFMKGSAHADYLH